MGKPRVDHVDLEDYRNIGRLLNKKHNIAANTTNLPPIVCVPGVGGSQLMANVQKESRTHWYCQKSTSWYMIWLQLYQLVPGPILECWTDNIELVYNETSGTFHNASGVRIEPNYPGTTQGFEYVDPDAQTESIYFAGLVEALLHLGYVRGQNLLGAPYDWRLSPNYLPEYFSTFQQTIENAYAVNNSKVAIVCHSMGNLFFLTFLRSVSQEWKDKYILTYVAASPPWVGAVAAVQSLTSGYDFSIPYLPPSSAKVVQRTFASNYFLLPYPKYYGEHVFVTTPSRNYTSLDYQALLTDLGIPEMYDPWTRSSTLVNPFEPPGVNTYCLYGYNVTTVKGEKYTTKDFTKPTLINGDGDGTVPIESLTFCNNWVNQTDKLTMVKGYKGQEHVNLMVYPEFVNDVLTAILNATKSA